MKTIYLAAAVALFASTASATTTQCERIGNSNNFRCPVGDTNLTVKGATSEANAAAHAAAFAAQKQAQQQAQSQGQSQSSSNSNRNDNDNTNINGNSNDNRSSASNSNANTSSISNVIEGNPAHTTSFNVGVGVSVRLGEGVRARAVQDAADWLAHNGQKCLAMEAMLELHPDLRRMNKTVKCVKH